MTSKPWWRFDTYDVEAPVPDVMRDQAGPKGLAMVKAWPSGVTDPGWGLLPPKGSNEGFMPRYMRNEFNERRTLVGYERDRWAFAFIMRSMRLVCIDIDGKNGGLEHAKELGLLPPTLAETSKSGFGYHLFYLVDEKWDDVKGFGLLNDRIGIVQGVDIRAVGCVYHHKQQRWNSRLLAELPRHLYDQLMHREQKVAAASERIAKVLANDDPMEVLMMHDELESELKKNIPAGKRNNTLFAIGSQMQEAGVEDWETKLLARADEVGLSAVEGEKLVQNIQRYAGVTP